jgi:hypothetical protein
MMIRARTTCLLAAAAIVAGCGGSGTSSPSSIAPQPTPAVTRIPPTQAASPSPTSTEAAPHCPNPEGGIYNKCLGPLTAGAHTTTAFELQLTYVVPEGWGNYEDFEGQVLLLPPGATVEGVNPGTSDGIGIAASVAAPLGDCTTQRDFKVGTTVESYVHWLRTDPRFVAKRPKPVTVDGMDGTMIDVALAPDAKPTCSDPELGIDRFAEVMMGLPPSHFSASVTGVGFQRFYLFDFDHRLMAFLVGDNPAGGSDYEDFLSVADAVIASFKFGVDP